ncbi:MAG: PAS domain S-box protein [Betaproteobacteria bacterium]|nr:MAG: PAS domain S-box protein [Betaproteobacteria bacterium]
MSTPPSAPVTYPELGAIIRRVQSRFIRAAPTHDIFDPLLTDLLEFTGSEYGFIADVLTDPADGHRFVRIIVLTDISWNYVTRAILDRQRSGEQALEFHNLSTLFGAAVSSGVPVIANDPKTDPRRGGLPPGHPGMDAFLGVPLFHGGDMVGLVGLANRTGGYDAALVEFLQPLFASVANIIGAVRTEEARRHAEQALRDSEERLRTTFEMAAVGIAHIAPDGRYQRVNRHLCQLLGYTREELSTMRYQDVTIADDLPASEAYVQCLLDGDAPSYALEKRYRHRSGAIVWASVSIAMVRDAAGAPAYFVSVIEDITPRKQTEAAMLAARAAERANAAKTEFLSRMSHELRTPLNAVLGFAQLLQMDAKQPLSSEQQTRVHHIENAGVHLLAMINDVLDLSRIESGSMPLTTTTVALPALVDEALALVATAARDADVRLLVEPPPAESSGNAVRADHLRLRQVLVNLLSNAIKYNRRDGTATVRWGVAADGAVQLQVSDTGQGLSAEQRAHLFEPFNRLGAERSGIEGTGIGLVVTQRLVQLMRGTIAVDSVPGHGSCFSVSLPSAHAEEAEPAAAEASPDSAPPRDATRRTVLYAEDNPMNVDLVREVLNMRPQCRLLVARNGREALTIARRERPDLMLLDMHLGDMSGLQVMQRLSHEGVLADVPCVALSADAMPAPIDAAVRAGFKAYLTKPLDVGAFLRCIDELLLSAQPAGLRPAPG